MINEAGDRKLRKNLLVVSEETFLVHSRYFESLNALNTDMVGAMMTFVQNSNL